MRLHDFFSLREMAIHEMAGMPKDNPYNGFMYQQLMYKYGSKYVPGGGAWPKGVTSQQKAQDVVEWHNQAAAEDIYPSKEPTPRTVIAALDWPFAMGSGQKSPNAAANMRKLAVDIGFATQEQMEELRAREGQKDIGLTPDAPKMSSVVKTDPRAKMSVPPMLSTPPVRTSPMPARASRDRRDPASDDFDI